MTRKDVEWVICARVWDLVVYEVNANRLCKDVQLPDRVTLLDDAEVSVHK